MAASDSTGLKLLPNMCEFCETNKHIQWICIQCNQYMCDKCYKIHLKVIMFDVHEIIEVNTPRNEMSEKLEHITCNVHKKKTMSMFCRGCDKLVCSDCICKSHKMHKLESIEKVCEEKMDKLSQLESAISEDLLLCKSEARDLHSTQILWESAYDTVIEKLDQQEQKIMEEVGKYAKQLRDEINMEKRVRRKMISEKKMKIEQAIQILENEKDEIQTVLKSNKKEIIFTVASELGSNLPELSFQSLPKEIIDFYPGYINDIPALLGSVNQTYASKLPQNIDFKLRKSYHHNMLCAHSLITLDDKTAWISEPTLPVLRQIKINDIIHTIKDIPVKVYDMALTSHGDIILSIYDSCDVKSVSPSWEINTFLSLQALIPHGIHVTKDHDILIGVKEADNNFKFTGKCWEILKFGLEKNQKQLYQYDKQKDRLFSVPHRITTNVNNDILVVDKMSDFENDVKENNDINGRIVVLGKQGNLKWTYMGHPHINSSENPFDPCDIQTTSVGHVIVADYSRNALHVLSKEGDLLTCQQMEEKGMRNLYSLDIDTRGQLWIWCDKLHIVKFCSK